MISLGKPSPHMVAKFLTEMLKQEFTYQNIGMTGEPEVTLSGFITDHYRVQLGRGAATFDKARLALKKWEQFNIGWVEVSDSAMPIETGSVIGLLTSFSALWLLFSCRIVYVLEEDGPIRRYGFAYGTLPGHPESGEERFSVEWNTADDSVWYDILALSHPGCLPTIIAYPVTRLIQKRFARDSQNAMLLATCNTTSF